MNLKTFKNREVGRTSSGVEEGFIFPNKAVISSIATEQKESKMDGLEEPIVRGLDKGEMFALTFTTLSIKYLRKLLQLLLEKSAKFGVPGETILFIVSNRTLGFLLLAEIRLEK